MRYPGVPQPGEARALERGHVAAASPNLHKHRDVVASSVGHDELIAALLPAHELGHLRVTRAD